MANFDNVRHLVHDMKYCTSKLLVNGFETLEVDNIIDTKISKDQKRHYLVCFKSWLPEDHLINYNDLIEEYWRKREEDEKKWKGSQDGESDKENNFISPTSSKTKRSFVFPSQTQSSPDGPTDNDKIKFTDNHNGNGLDIGELPLDIPDGDGIKREDNSDGDDEDENFQLRIDESNEHLITTPVFNNPKDNFVDRLINTGSPPRSSPEGISYSQSVNYSNNLPIYNGGSDDVDENSIDYLVKPSPQSNCETPSTHLSTSFHLSNSDNMCDDDTHRSKMDEIPIIEPICDEELPGFDVKRDGKLVNGDRHVDEFDVPRCEDGRLSLYSDEPIDDEPIDEEQMDGEAIDEFDETLIDEDGEDSDVSEFGVDVRHPDELYNRRDEQEMNGDRTSSDYSDTTPENMKLNRFTPLNTVQVNNSKRVSPSIPTSPDDTMLRRSDENENDFPDHRSTPTSNFDDSAPHSNSMIYSSSDSAANANTDVQRCVNTSDRPPKKRKGKTLDDIVRKISSANEQAAEKKSIVTDEDTLETETKNENSPPWTNGDDSKFIKKELLENDLENTENSQPDVDGTSSATHDGNRENNVYWSAGKAFHKRNISYKCKFCEHRFDDETLLKDHERSHGQHQCRNCNEVFLTSAALFEHREVAHAFKPRQRYNKCRFCPTLYADPAMLQRHEEIHHLSRSPVTPGHGEDGATDLPPPLMSIDESQRKFPRYENHRELKRNEHGYRPRSPREMKPPGRSSSDIEHYERREIAVDDEEGKSIVRNPIRNLLGKMYQTQKKMEHGGGERFAHRYSGYRSKMTPATHQFHYADYPRCYSSGPQNRSSPEHPQRDIREYRPDMRPDNTPPTEEDGKDFRELVHICRICNKSFGMKERLEQHWLTAHADTPTFRCEVCHEIFLDKDELDSHMSIHLKQDYYCGYCRKTFDCRANYETHMRAHNNDRPFTCHICGRAFSLRTNLRRHILIHTDITPYRCHVCFKGFRRSDMLSSHIKQYHVGSNDEKCRNFDPNDPAYRSDRRPEDGNTGDSVSPVFQPPSGGNSPYTPRHENNNINGHEGYNNTSPSQHSDDPKVYTIESRMKQSPDSIPMKHSPSSPRRHHSPNVSSRHEAGEITAMNHSMVPMNHLPNVVGMHQVPNEHNFHRPNGIITPMGSDRPPSHQLVTPIPVMKQARFSPYKTNLVNILPLPVTSSRMECNECGEKFTSESLYEIHMQSHVKEASYTCRKCRRTFSGKSQYNSHMQTHENNKSHSCPYCHRSFSMKGNLRRHIRIHTNEAPYECPICFQRFRRSDGLKGHIKRHDAMGESAPGDMVPSQAST